MAPDGNDDLRTAAKHHRPEVQAPRRRKSIPTSPTSIPDHVVPLRERKTVLWLFVMLKVMTSYDNGAFSAVLGVEDGLLQELSMTMGDVGTLGSIVFVGNTVGCLLAGYLADLLSSRIVLIAAMAIHTEATLLFAMSESFVTCCIARVLIGLTLAAVVVLSVVWIEDHAPTSSSSTWMALNNVGVPIGTALGYLVGGIVVPALGMSWRQAFVGKGVVMIFILIAIAFVPSRALEPLRCDPDEGNEEEAEEPIHDGATLVIKNEGENEATSSSATAVDCGAALATESDAATPVASSAVVVAADEPPACRNSAATGSAAVGDVATSPIPRRTHSETLSDAFAKAALVLANPLFTMCSATLCCLFFVVTALQVFATPFLRGAPFSASMNTIVIGFGSAAVTAPVFGVLVGGIALDRLGGYRGKTKLASTFALTAAAAAGVFAISATMMWTISSFLICLWGMFFCGAAVIPAASGMMMVSVAPEHRSVASSLANVGFNVFGYFLGPFVCGRLAQYTLNLSFALNVVLYCSVFGCVPLALLAFGYVRGQGAPPSGDGRLASARTRREHGGTSTPKKGPPSSPSAS